LETICIREVLDITNDDRALEHFNKSVWFEDGRYYIAWPWKYENPDLPDNFGVAIKRVRSLVRCFEKDKALLAKYNEILQSQVQQGVIERVSNDNQHTLKHYLLYLTTQF